jgi:very-short-patch-repair endonuclease
VSLHQAQLPPPELQFEVRNRYGDVVARCDFGWPQFRTVAEFDGRIKYGRLLRPGEAAGDAVFREKNREDMLRDLGWEVVRWMWADLRNRREIAERLERAFARGVRR